MKWMFTGTGLRASKIVALVENRIMENVALLVYACDRYQLLYKGFDYFFRKNWDSNLKIKEYFATEILDLNFSTYENLKSGKGEWSNRLKRVLDQIDEEYIIFFQEDMWMSGKVKDGVLELVLDHMKSHELDLLKLHSSEVYETEEIGVDFNGLSLTKVLKDRSNFLMSHQVSIWKKSFLFDQLQDNEHPWRNERRGSKRLKKNKSEIFQLDYLSENGKSAINANKDENASGEYHTISVNACISKNAVPFIEELKSIDSDYADKLMHNHIYGITHDGKKKPRKEDLVKKNINRVMSAFNKGNE